MKQYLADLLLKYTSGRMSRQTLVDELEIFDRKISQRLANRLYIEDLFLHNVVSWITTNEDQAYNAEEILMVLDALNGKGPLEYYCVLRVSNEMLDDYEMSILTISRDLLEKVSENVELDSLSSICLSDSAMSEWKTIRRKRISMRMELYKFKTITEWLAYQIEWLMWMMPKGRKTQICSSELIPIIQKYVSILSGSKKAYIKLGMNYVSII